MDITFGVHTGPASCTADELHDLWTRIEPSALEAIAVAVVELD